MQYSITTTSSSIFLIFDTSLVSIFVSLGNTINISLIISKDFSKDFKNYLGSKILHMIILNSAQLAEYLSEYLS